MHSKHNINRFLITVIVIILLTDLSCKRENEKTGKKNPVIAKVNGEAITLQDFENEKKFMFFSQTEAPQGTTDIINRNLLGKIIDKKILLQEAAKNNVTISMDAVEKEISKIKNNYPGDTFLKFFNENQISYDEWKNKLLELMTIQKLLNSVVESNPSVSEEEIYLYYKAHADDFKNINKIILRQILVQDAKTAEDVKKRLQSGESFEKLAAEFSTGYEKKNGGLLPPLSSHELPNELEDVFKLNVGQIFGPVKTDYGYHIVKIEKKFVRKKMNLKEAKSAIIEILKQEKYNNSLKEYLTNVRKNARIEIFSSEILNPGKT